MSLSISPYELIILQMNIIITIIILYHMDHSVCVGDRNPKIKSGAGGGPETRVSLGVA